MKFCRDKNGFYRASPSLEIPDAPYCTLPKYIHIPYQSMPYCTQDHSKTFC